MSKKATKGWMSELSAPIWGVMENTDSWAISSMGDAEKAAAAKDELFNAMEIHSVLDAIAHGRSLPAPVVLLQGNGVPYLVAGEIRLMVAKAMEITPQIFWFDMSVSESPHDVPHLMQEQGKSPPRADR